MLRPIDKRFDRRFSHSIKLIFDNYVPKYEELNHGTPTEKERLQFNSWKTIWSSKEQSIELRIRCDNYNEILHCELLRNYRTKRGIFFQSRNEILLWTIDGCRADEVGPVVKSIQLNSSETFKLAEKIQWTNDLNDSMRFERAHNKPVTMANIMPFISQNQQTNVCECVWWIWIHHETLLLTKSLLIQWENPICIHAARFVIHIINWTSHDK